MIIGIYGGIVFFLIIGFIVLLYSWKRQRIDLPQILPFLVWQFLVIIPFLAQASNMERIAALWQAIGIEIINVGLIVYLGLPKKKISFHKIQTNCVWHKMWRILNSGYFYTILFFLIVTYHIISLNGNIPLINSLMGVGDSVTMREEAVKLLDVPFFMKYIFRWTTNIIAPIAIILYWNKKQYAMCFLQFVLHQLKTSFR